MMESGSSDFKILLLGEGNFSFTLSLCTRLKGLLDSVLFSGRKITLVTSAFDSESEISRKYPEASHTANQLQKFEQLDIHILYNIDSTKPYLEQLSSTSASCVGKFDSIIFNFPHLGIEDAQTHGSMVAHTMKCLQGVLSDSPKSHFLLALADAQWERWNVCDKAARNNMSLLEKFHFSIHDWPGYEIKRHINGKGFHNRVKDCSYFCYTRVLKSIDISIKDSDSDSDGNNNVILHLLAGKEEYEVDNKEMLTEKTGENKEKEQEKEKEKKEKKGKKRRVEELTDGCWRFLKAAEDHITPAYECMKCLRQFSKEQAVIAHVYNVHVLACNGGDDQSDTKAKTGLGYQCSLCNPVRDFGSEIALQAHCTSVHGKFNVLKPVWAASEAGNSINDSKIENGDDTIIECAICGVHFSTEAELGMHLSSGYQPIDTQKNFFCGNCNKTFTQERALNQHMNFCTNSNKL